MVVRAHGFALETMGDWLLVEGWTEPSVQALHGLCLRSVPLGIQLQIRGQTPGAHELDQHGLLALLREQQWASPPFDEATTRFGHLTVVGATFAMSDAACVREIFVTDGRSLANAAMTGTRAELRAAAAIVEHLLGTLRFDEGGGSSSHR